MTIYAVGQKRITRLGDDQKKSALRAKTKQFIAYFNEAMANPFRWTMEAKPIAGEAKMSLSFSLSCTSRSSPFRRGEVTACANSTFFRGSSLPECDWPFHHRRILRRMLDRVGGHLPTIQHALGYIGRAGRSRPT